MSKIIIITNHWMERSNTVEMKAFIFNDRKEYEDDYSASKKIYAQVRLDHFLSLATRPSEIYGFLGLQNNDEAIPVLCKFVQRILKTNFWDEEMQGYFKDDIANADKDRLEVDIYESLKFVKDHEQLNDLFCTIIAEQRPLMYYCKADTDNNDEYRVIGIPSFPRDFYARRKYCDKWIDALINNFTSEGDEVVLALHGSSDWKEADPVLGPRQEYSEQLTQAKKRKIRLFLFQHEDFDCVAQVLQSNESLSTIWNKLDKEYGASK